MSEVKQRKPKVLIPEVKIQQRVKEIAQQINLDFAGEELTVICTLKGSFIFFADLIRHIELPMTCEFLGVSSYGNHTVTSGEVKVTLDINEPLEGRNVLIVEDIVDSGLSLNYMINLIKGRKPGTLRTCSLLMKPDALRVPLQVDYVGFDIGNEFVVGYGLDYAQKLRGLPYIGYIENEH